MNEEDARHRSMVRHLHSFLYQLCQMHYPPTFILQTGFEFALRQQYALATGTGEALAPPGNSTVWMEQAASLLEEAVNLDKQVYYQLFEG